MASRTTRVLSWVALAAGLAAVGSARAQLVSKSPFESARAAGAAAPTSNAPLEFLGYLEVGQGPQFRLHDPSTKQSVWVGLNESNNEIAVTVKKFNRGYDGHDNRSDDTLTVEHRGTVHTLPIRKAKVISGGPVPTGMPPPPPVAVQSNVAPAVTQTVVLNPTPADEKARLDAVAAEIARRRSVRLQAEQTVNQPQPVPAPPPAPPANMAPQPR